MNEIERIISLEKDVKFIKENEESARVARTMATRFVDEAIEKNNKTQLMQIENMFLKQEAAIKEHINYTQGLQRKDIQDNRAYCEGENIKIEKKLRTLADKINKFGYALGGGTAVVGVIWLVVEAFI
jgi:hypothetical protein